MSNFSARFISKGDIKSGKAWFPQAAPVLDFAWYPAATPNDPASYCFVTSVRECPVKLLDASDGRLRASYRIVDHRERHIAPHALSFNPLANRLYCGFEDAIEVFDLHAPGEGTRLHTTPTKKSKDGLKGIISTLAFSSDLSSGLFAAGSLNPSPPTSSNIALFTESAGETPVMFVGDQQEDRFGIRSSCTQVIFNPFRPYLLYASFRRHDIIYCWDLRGDVSTAVQTFDRNTRARRPDITETNQKIRFDIDLGGRYLAVGDQCGDISMFNLTSTGDDTVLPYRPEGTKPLLQYHAHDDTVGSVAFHPSRALLLSVSGSRHFDTPRMSDSDSDDGVTEDEAHIGVKRWTLEGKPGTRDNSLKLWDFERKGEFLPPTESNAS
ncbi:hypothetical protein QCA50_012331 [Cerrena zonata]|uniref:Uncharacterized protein n=1 Tax=Cerrena zonata TaxID=2478898 RepID=A0AAW0G1X6_9APHY